MLGLETGPERKQITSNDLEHIRKNILLALKEKDIPYNGTLWGWNFGFGCAHNGYRQHASHQQIHQQFALLPKQVKTQGGEAAFPSYGCGDLVQDFIIQYQKETDHSFFEDYLKSIYTNSRTDGRSSKQSGLSRNLVIYEDEKVLLFVPKAQTSQWELQLMTKFPVGNILETDTGTRDSLDLSILKAMQCLTRLGAQMITVIEYSKRFDVSSEQHLLYAFLPKLPYAGIAFTEQQMRWICGHYPEDFAESCRRVL